MISKVDVLFFDICQGLHRTSFLEMLDYSSLGLGSVDTLVKCSKCQFCKSHHIQMWFCRCIDSHAVFK